ncbi:MAG: LrgB family protein [Solirubrobacterales bacterium]|nr:LrgB family protein [Solirubrobacterales bacterium]
MTALLALTATLVAYQAARSVNRRGGGHPLLNPVLLAIIALGALLALTGIKYRAYFQGAQPINLLLGPAVVALAVPLHRQLSTIRRSAPAVLSALAIGSLAAIGSAVAISQALGASATTVLSLAPKSATAAVAIGISRQLGGIPSLTAALTISTGIIGAILGPGLLARLKLHDDRAAGLALGVASHGIGTARALQIGEALGAFAGLGLALNALATPLLLSVLDALHLLPHHP